MAGGKETPRQKMIGILYLVLLGMIALSLSDTVLESFKDLKLSLDSGSRIDSLSTSSLHKNYKDVADKDQQKEKAMAIYQRATDVTLEVKKAVDAIDTIQSQLFKAGGKDIANTAVSYREMIRGGKAEKLKSQLLQVQAKIKDKTQLNAFGFNLDLARTKTIDAKKLEWDEINFGENLPLIAVLTNLSKIKADLRNDEAKAVTSILQEIGSIIKINRFEAVAVAPTSYLIQGQPYTADVFLTGYDNDSKPTITVNGSSIPVTNGRGKYTVNTSSVGEFPWSARINISGVTFETPIQKYQVAKPSAVVSADNMNVIYAGIPNPFSVSAPGIATGNIQVSMTKGTISGSGGKYSVNSRSVGATAVISVKATIGGNLVNLGSTTFKVKKLPDPVAYFAGSFTGATVNSTKIAGQGSIKAAADPKSEFTFNTPILYSIKSWKLTVFSPENGTKTAAGSGSALNSPALNAIRSITSEGVVYFYDIVASGPDGVDRTIDPVVINVN
jgi:gliding motility-associated protein GldM